MNPPPHKLLLRPLPQPQPQPQPQQLLPLLPGQMQMKKKRLAVVTVPDTDVDFKSIIHNHSLFLDKLVELIPAKFYLSDDKDRPWFQGLSKAKKASAKKETRINIKKARRARLDPDNSSITTLDLLKKNLDKEKASIIDSDYDDATAKPITPGEDGSVTYEEIRQRLRRRIEEYRANRTSRDDGELSARDRKRLEYKENRENRRKRDGGAENRNPTVARDKTEKDMDEAAKELTFGYVKLGDDEEHRKKKRKLAKSKELEKAKELEEAKKDPEKSKKVLWSSATSRAAGVKVHDDPKRLKQSLQKDKRKHQKNVEKWKDRTETTQKMKSEKQQKRAGNIAERAQQKKMRKIAKREKKLMRPGFEGRKEGFINEGKS